MLRCATHLACTATRLTHSALTHLQPLATLLARCWVSYVFLKAGLLKLDNWPGTVMLFTHEFHVPLLAAECAAFIATAAEIILPAFIIIGLGGRITVLLLFLFNLAAVTSYPHLWTPDGLGGLRDHINWGAILMLLMTFGTGRWTLDHLLWNRCKGFCPFKKG